MVLCTSVLNVRFNIHSCALQDKNEAKITYSKAERSKRASGRATELFFFSARFMNDYYVFHWLLIGT